MNVTWSYGTAFSRHDGLLTSAEQEQLRHSRVAIIGMGGVGGIHLITLARLGIGKFTIADPDRYELANMNRQYGAHVDTLGRSKAEVMTEEVRRINPEVELKVFTEAIRPETVSDFLGDASLFVDGIDFFSIGMRRSLFRQAAKNTIYGVTAGPLGFSTAWLTFAPGGMSFDEYFDLNDGQSELEQLVCFLVGLAPKALHRPYIDWSRVSLEEKKGPSAGLACNLCAGVIAAESVKILLGRQPIRSAPCYSQFDAYRGVLRRGRLWMGNRHPIQLFKRAYVLRQFRNKPIAGISTSPSPHEAGG